KPEPKTGHRFFDADRCFEIAAATPWGRDLRGIPATLIDKGVLRFVPYHSFQAGDYEINVYGDPDWRCCVEIAVRAAALGTKEAKENCLAFMEKVLLWEADRYGLSRLNLTEDSRKVGGMTLEVTPPTAEDAYGGWWVSVYDEEELDRSRATPPEVT